MEKILVDLGKRSYPIFIGSGLLQNPNSYIPMIRAKQVAIVTNETVAPLYLEKLQNALHNFKLSTIVLPDGEQYKNLASIEKIFDALLVDKHHRDTTLIALGGGVIGDMTGFAAACYQRGVDFIQVPTTLLAQVDSSVGGKTGVNHPLGKNMIGAFHQPRVVVADIDTLKTLPAREFAAGIAEVVKYGLIYDSAFFLWIEKHVDALLKHEETILIQAIKRSCEIKAEVVAADETESGLRAILNLGHTFGHVIETAMHYQGILHGEAVAIGMVMAAELSSRQGWLASAEVTRIVNLLERFALPTRPHISISVEEFCDHMMLDKKVKNAKLNLVLLESIGKACITSDFDQRLLEATISKALF